MFCSSIAQTLIVLCKSDLDGGFIMSPKAHGGDYGLELFHARPSLDDGNGHDLRSQRNAQPALLAIGLKCKVSVSMDRTIPFPVLLCSDPN